MNSNEFVFLAKNLMHDLHLDAVEITWAIHGGKLHVAVCHPSRVIGVLDARVVAQIREWATNILLAVGNPALAPKAQGRFAIVRDDVVVENDPFVVLA